jgi:MYXO-CTERM domain-containing protein
MRISSVMSGITMLTAAIAATGLLAASGRAATLSVANGGARSTVNTLPASGTPGTGTDGYAFFATSPLPTTSGWSNTAVVLMPAYASVTAGDNGWGWCDASDSVLTIGSTRYTTGAYGGNTADDVLITLQGTVPSVVRLGVLMDNAGAGANTITWDLTISSPTNAFATQTYKDESYTIGTNNFAYFDISGGTAGDQIMVSGSTFGGIALSHVAATPEPASLALLALGALLVLPRRRHA